MRYYWYMYCMRICTLVHTSNKQVCIQNQTNWYKLNNTQHEAHYSSGKIISQHFSSPIRLDPSAAYGALYCIWQALEIWSEAGFMASTPATFNQLDDHSQKDWRCICDYMHIYICACLQIQRYTVWFVNHTLETRNHQPALVHLRCRSAN